MVIFHACKHPFIPFRFSKYKSQPSYFQSWLLCVHITHMTFQLLSCVIRPAESTKAESSEHFPNLLCFIHTDGEGKQIKHTERIALPNCPGRKPQETSLL